MQKYEACTSFYIFHFAFYILADDRKEGVYRGKSYNNGDKKDTVCFVHGCWFVVGFRY